MSSHRQYRSDREPGPSSRHDQRSERHSKTHRSEHDRSRRDERREYTRRDDSSKDYSCERDTRHQRGLNTKSSPRVSTRTSESHSQVERNIQSEPGSSHSQVERNIQNEPGPSHEPDYLAIPSDDERLDACSDNFDVTIAVERLKQKAERSRQRQQQKAIEKWKKWKFGEKNDRSETKQVTEPVPFNDRFKCVLNRAIKGPLSAVSRYIDNNDTIEVRTRKIFYAPHATFMGTPVLIDKHWSVFLTDATVEQWTPYDNTCLRERICAIGAVCVEDNAEKFDFGKFFNTKMGEKSRKKDGSVKRRVKHTGANVLVRGPHVAMIVKPSV